MEIPGLLPSHYGLEKGPSFFGGSCAGACRAQIQRLALDVLQALSFPNTQAQAQSEAGGPVQLAQRQLNHEGELATSALKRRTLRFWESQCVT